MRIAVASEGLDVCSHFGCCTNFNYYKIVNNHMVDSHNLPSQGHLCGSQANFLRQIEVSVLICGAISQQDINAMNKAGITVVSGASGRATAAVEAYLREQSSDLASADDDLDAAGFGSAGEDTGVEDAGACGDFGESTSFSGHKIMSGALNSDQLSAEEHKPAPYQAVL